MNSTLDKDKKNIELDDTFFDIDLSEAFKDIYHLTDNNELKESFRNKEKETNLRNENYKKYYNINMSQLSLIEEYFKDTISEINKLYKSLKPKTILEETYSEAKNTKQILSKIYKKLSELSEELKTKSIEIENYNEEKQTSIDIKSIKNMDIEKKKKDKVLRLYEDLLLYSSNVSKDLFENFNIQMNRKKIIDKFYNEIEEELNKEKNKKELEEVNNSINILLKDYENKINNLREIISPDSKYKGDLDKLNSFYSKILDYNVNDLEKAKKTLEILGEDNKISTFYSNLKDKIDKENEKIKSDESKKKLQKKVNKEIVLNSLNYLNNNYLSILDKDSKKVIKKIEKVINNEVDDYNEIFEALKIIIDNIWSKVITSPYDYKKDSEYNFIVTKSNILDPKQEAFLLSTNTFDKMSEINEFQIGFICSYSDNILYFTEKKDIMLAKQREYINYKTPYQIENEFINDDIITRIALDGSKTKVEGVYIINSTNKKKYKKALELSNSLNIPLIELKK